MAPPNSDGGNSISRSCHSPYWGIDQLSFAPGPIPGFSIESLQTRNGVTLLGMSCHGCRMDQLSLAADSIARPN